jgi:hypothetical protein
MKVCSAVQFKLAFLIAIQNQRPLPTIPEKVSYFNLQEVKRDSMKCDGWIQLKSDNSVLVLGQYDHTVGSLSKRVVINADLSVNVFFEGMSNIQL